METSHQAQFRPVIERRLAEIETALKSGADGTEPIAPDVAVGRLSRLDSMQMQQMALAGQRRLEAERARLHEALRRIDGGSYGRCLLCNRDIADERLEYQPDAVSCVACMNRRK